MSVIIILACVAVFVGLRLYSVLGRRTGHEQQPMVPRPADAAPSPVLASAPGIAARGGLAEAGTAAIDPAAMDGVRAVVSADPKFDVAAFLDGAKGAYRQVLEAFWSGDVETLDRLCAADVAAAFRDAIAAREAAGETLDNRLVAIERAAIDGAGVADKAAILTVRFDADIAAVTRDREGTVVAGSMSDAIQTHDLWTFRRPIRASDPNWLLIETDEAA